VAAGQNLIGGLGSLDNANGMSSEQIVMQCGLADMAEYVARGIDLSEEKLAVESLLRTGPGGNFLTDELTLALLRSGEFFYSPLVDLTGGYTHEAPGMLEIAHRKVVELVESYRPTVPSKVREAIEQFFRDKPARPG